MIESRELQAYLARVFRRPVELLGVRPLKDNLGEGSNPKAFGYGVPLEVECLIGGEPRQFVRSRARPEEGFRHRDAAGPAARGGVGAWGPCARAASWSPPATRRNSSSSSRRPRERRTGSTWIVSSPKKRRRWASGGWAPWRALPPRSP